MEVPNQHVLWPLLELRPGALEAKLASAAENSSGVSASSTSQGESLKSPSVREGIAEQMSANPSQRAQRVERPHNERPPSTSSEQVGSRRIKVYRVPFRLIVAGQLIIYAGFLLFGLVLLTLGVAGPWLPGRWALESSVSLSIVGAVITVIGLLALLFALWELSTRVELFNEGISYSRGRVRTFCRWEDVRECRWWWFGEPSKQAQGSDPGVCYDIITSTGKVLRFGVEIDQLFELVAHIQKETERRRLPELLEQFYAGEAIQFTDSDRSLVIVSREGVKGDNWSLDWNEITGVRWQDNHLWFSKRGSWYMWGRVSMLNMNNSHLIVPLVEEILRRRNAEPQKSR
jgi:hypothetical protein